MKVPFLDLKIQYEAIQPEIDEAIQQVINSCAFSGGPFVDKFENEFAEFCQCKYAVGVGNGTEALWLTLLASGIGSGDEVITVSNTFIATAEAVSYCGAQPVFIDINEQTYNMNIDLLEKAVTPKTKAIIPVHLFGQPADMDFIMEFAREHKLCVIEDACQAHGAEYKNKRSGSIGDAGCFSFYPGKNLGAYGEAGAVVTNNIELAGKIRMLRDHGQPKKYYHEIIGWNARMDGLQGAILSVKLKHLTRWNEERRKNAILYNKLLADINDINLPEEVEHAKHVYHIYAIRCSERDELIKTLAGKNIYCGIHYPMPVHFQDAYKSKVAANGNLPITEMYANELVSLPMFPELSPHQIEFVADEIKKFH